VFKNGCLKLHVCHAVMLSAKSENKMAKNKNDGCQSTFRELAISATGRSKCEGETYILNRESQRRMGRGDYLYSPVTFKNTKILSTQP